MFIVTPQEIQFFKVFIGKLVELTQESLMLGFSNIQFWNGHKNWTLKTCAIHTFETFFLKSSSGTL